VRAKLFFAPSKFSLPMASLTDAHKIKKKLKKALCARGFKLYPALVFRQLPNSSVPLTGAESLTKPASAGIWEQLRSASNQSSLSSAHSKFAALN
jgi:hypothetical protein